MYEAVIKPRKCGQEILRSHWYSPRDESGLSPSSTTLKLPSRFSSLRRVPLATSVPKPRSLNSSLLSDEEMVSGLSVEVMGGTSCCGGRPLGKWPPMLAKATFGRWNPQTHRSVVQQR